MASRTKYNNPQSGGSLGLPYHYEMVSDRARVGAFAAAIERCCRGAVVVESGTGSGILALLAARAGAKKVYSVDIDPRAIAVARANLARSGFTNVEIHHMSSLELTREHIGGEVAGVIMAENMSTWQVLEPQVEVMNHLNRELAGAHTLRIPARIDNCLCLAQAVYEFEGLVRVPTHFFEFTGVPAARPMSAVVTCESLDMAASDNPLQVRRTLQVRATNTGVVNALRLTSKLELAPGVEFAGSDSLNPPVVVPLRAELRVEAGDWVEVELEFSRGQGWEDFVCVARPTVGGASP